MNILKCQSNELDCQVYRDIFTTSKYHYLQKKITLPYIKFTQDGALANKETIEKIMHLESLLIQIIAFNINSLDKCSNFKRNKDVLRL